MSVTVACAGARSSDLLSNCSAHFHYLNRSQFLAIQVILEGFGVVFSLELIITCCGFSYLCLLENKDDFSWV